jgi:very-short-patch-repair endonuclease
VIVNGFVPTPFQKFRYAKKVAFARHLRQNMTSLEVAVWERIRSYRLGVKFRRQVILFGWIPDFYSPSIKLVLEVDGPHHDAQEVQAKDHYKDATLSKMGLSVYRISYMEIENDIDLAIDRLKREIQILANLHQIDLKRK